MNYVVSGYNLLVAFLIRTLLIPIDGLLRPFKNGGWGDQKSLKQATTVLSTDEAHSRPFHALHSLHSLPDPLHGSDGLVQWYGYMAKKICQECICARTVGRVWTKCV